VRLRQADGRHFWARITLTILTIRDVSLLLAFEDVTGQRHADAALREADRRKDDFLALVSHELRTPLSVLMIHSMLLQRKDLDPKIRHSGEAMERAAKAQARLVDDLLDVSSIAAGRLTIELGSVRLDAIVRGVVEELSREARKRQVALVVQIDPDIPPTSGDSSRLQQALTNIVGNALKFTPQGGRICVDLLREDSELRIEVSDTGAGIDPAFLPYVFERFSQADQTITRRTGGLGLGLAIVQSIVKAHGGVVEARSEGLGHGSTFTMSVPLTAIPEQSPSLTTEGRRARKIGGARILIVEDDPGTRSTLGELLTDAGAEVREADSARAAMGVLDAFEPDILVCDVAMPDEDGCTLLHRIRTRSAGRAASMRAVALTAYASDEDRARTRAAGFEKHLVKPVDIEQLVTAISNLLPEPSRAALTP
jgi:two-component system CheB/CheR fusion protein